MLEEARVTLTDEVIELHERMLNSLFSKAKRTQAERLQQTGKLIQSKLRQYIDVGQALSEARLHPMQKKRAFSLAGSQAQIWIRPGENPGAIFREALTLSAAVSAPNFTGSKMAGLNSQKPGQSGYAVQATAFRTSTA